MFTPRSFGKVGVEAYAAYALRAWLAGEHSISGRTRRFAKWSAICSFALGMAGQVAYHLLAQAWTARAPWPVTMIVSCLPVLVLAMGTTLAHMLRADAGSAADTPDNVTGGPAVSRSRAWFAEDQASAARDQAAPQAPRAGTGPSAGTTTARQQDHDARAVTAIPSGIGEARMAASRLTAAGRAVSRRALHSEGIRGSNERGPERPGAHDQRRAGGHSSCPGQTRQRHGANLIPRRRPCSWRTRPAAGRRSRGYGRLRQRPRAEVRPPLGREG
jgi:hypothetical protein